MDPKEILAQLQGELKNFIDKANAEQKSLGTVLAETKSAIDGINQRINEIEVRMAKPDNSSEGKSFADELKENESLQRLMRDGRGNATIRLKNLSDLEQKTTITSTAVGSATSGILLFDRTPGIVPAARRRLFLKDMMTVIPTSMNSIDYVKVNADISDASPQVEASDKHENALTFTTATAAVRTIATWIPATKQILDDFVGLEGFIRTSLAYAVNKKVEDELLSGSNTGQDLNGLITQATSFDTSLLSATDGWEYADIVGRAIQQIETANESQPNFVAFSPASYWKIRLTKDTTGQYIYGPPSSDVGNFQLFGLTAIRTNAMSGATFLVGSSSPTDVVVREREGLNIELSTEHSDYFVKNMVAIRAECRLAQVVFRPAAYIYGTFTTSPA